MALFEAAGIEDTTEMNMMLTKVGGLAVRLLNKTGADSIKGTAVDADHANDMAVHPTEVDAIDCIGFIYEDGVPDGEYVWVVVAGIAEVLLEDATSATRGNWCVVGSQAGRVDATATAPAGGTLQDHQVHFGEVGHCLENKDAGTDVLCKILTHFN